MTHEFETAVWNHLLEHPFCIQCGKQAKTVYYTKETDNIPEILELNGIRYVPVCARCKNAIKKNLRVCPQCKTNYIPITWYKCTDCLTTEERITLRVARNDQKRKDRLHRVMVGSG
jgi:protein-arginine kinase activator protein McsA